MEELLLRLLERLEEVGEDHEEISDTENRNAMRGEVHDGFLQPDPNWSMPSDFGLTSEEGNLRVRDAIEEYIKAANAKAAELGLNFRGRLLAFQNVKVSTAEGTTYDEFFGYTPPSRWTESGEWLGNRS